MRFLPLASYHVVPVYIMSGFAQLEAAGGSQAEMELEPAEDPGSGSHAADAWSVSLKLIWFLEIQTVLPRAAGSALHWMFAVRMWSVALAAVAILLVLAGGGPAELGQLKDLHAKGPSLSALPVVAILTLV